MLFRVNKQYRILLRYTEVLLRDLENIDLALMSENQAIIC